VGPPGCGKTLIAKAVGQLLPREARVREDGQQRYTLRTSSTSRAPSSSTKYVGETERQIRAHLSSRAAGRSPKKVVPVIVFFDEMDSLFPHPAGLASRPTLESTIVPRSCSPRSTGVESLKKRDRHRRVPTARTLNRPRDPASPVAST